MGFLYRPGGSGMTDVPPTKRSKKPKVLFVDDEPEILQSIKLSLRKVFQVVTATSGREGLQAIQEQGPFSVVVSDMRMPVMNGARFLSAVQDVAPESVRMLLTGETDLDSAVMAVNNGAIFRFLKKPCDKEDLIAALDAAVEQHELVTSERDMLQNTLLSSVRLLTDILGHVHPEAFSRSARMHKIVEHLVGQLKLPDPWSFEVAGMLAHLGFVTFPPTTVEKFCAKAPLADWEEELIRTHPQVGHDMVNRIPRLEPVADMIARQHTIPSDEERQGLPMRWDPAVLGGELIRLASAYDRAVTSGQRRSAALETLRAPRFSFSESLLKHLDDYEDGHDEMVEAAVMLKNLAPGMVVRTEIRTVAGGLLASVGQVLDQTMIARLQNFNRTSGIQEPIKVLSPSHLLSAKESA